VWFIGVPMSLGADERELVPASADLVATRAADRHLTLVFLGRAPDHDVATVWQSVPALGLPSTVDAHRWERFGRSAIALVVSDDDGLLDAAATVCHDAADGLIEVRRPSPFRPHVTMARVPRRARPPSSGALRGWPLPASPLEVGALTLFRSRTDPGTDRYEIVEQLPGTG
jgi:2'-5' RNA ligase